jgi:phosphoglycerate dehydrogenase-like enzyme
MRLLAFDLVQDAPFADRHEVAYVALEEVLLQSDFISLHLFLGPAFTCAHMSAAPPQTPAAARAPWRQKS